jgi:hypothetical protein
VVIKNVKRGTRWKGVVAADRRINQLENLATTTHCVLIVKGVERHSNVREYNNREEDEKYKNK